MGTGPKKIMFYVQHLLGIGHLARASLICEQFAQQGHDITMVMGGTPVNGFPSGSVKVLQLPILKAGVLRFNDLTDEHGQIVGDTYKQNRCELLLEFFNSFQPDVLIIEAFPFGRRQMRFELLPLLEAAKQATKKPIIAGSVRDIVQEKNNPKRAIETVETLNKYFDLLLVHGDPSFAKLDETFERTNEIQQLVRYTGLVAGKVTPLMGPSYDVVVSAGGGVAGEAIMLNALKAKPLSKLATANWVFLVGPNLCPHVRAKLSEMSDNSVTIENSRPDFRALLARAKLSISQAGYNTTADILQAKCSSILVPYAQGGETEQSLRAEKLQQQKLVSIVNEDELTPQKLAHAIDIMMSTRGSVARTDINMTGASKSVELLLML